MHTTEIITHILRMRSSGRKMYSNCFAQFERNLQKEWAAACSEKSLYIVNCENGVRRIWFYTIDFYDLAKLFEKLDSEEEYIAEIITKDAMLYRKAFEACGFQKYAVMMRLSNPDILSVISDGMFLAKTFAHNIGRKAEEKDAEAVHRKLWEIFDCRISHLQTLEEIRKSIYSGQIYVAEDEKRKIAAILQRVVAPKSFYINQIYNSLEPHIIHSILLNELKKYTDSGGRYVYAWVEKSNVASQKFHAKYGLKHDGLLDMIYIRKRKIE